MARKPREVAYTHDATRTHIPESGFVDYAKPPKQPTKTYNWDPRESPQLVWAGKAGLRRVEVDEEASLEVPVVNLHIHERISAEGILRAVRREDAQRSLFADPDLEFKDDIRYYEHQVGWSNRMVLGDSLLVMNSLLEREGMRGQVQCIYMDPPYGIKYASNFQPRIDQRDVKDGKDEDLTREVMQVQAFRDTWELGVHSYLTYLRDRLLLARELLKDEGSIFVQIGDENVHRVRCLMDEVFREENFAGQIGYVTTGGQSANLLGNVFDSVIWYARDITKTKYRQLYIEKELREGGGWAHSRAELEDGSRANLGVPEVRRLLGEGKKIRPYSQDGTASQGATGDGAQPLEYQGRKFRVPANSHWKTSIEGMYRLARANRLEASENSIRYVRFL
ncbi:MAG: site-specific DNA-methyltransferase, partial [Fimbriimonadaceae bacterium]|nr:site-specific DNA-methyltransferase [Fimbriimonadaceae bacterium]